MIGDNDVILSKTFIRISNKWLTNAEQNNIFSKIGTEGFTIYCMLLQIKGSKDKFQVNIKQIQQLLKGSDYKNRPKIKYSKNKINHINVIKDVRTMKKYLKLLHKYKLINIKEDIDKIKANDFIIIDVMESKYKNGFTAIAENLILDKIHMIGHIGFSLLYILTSLFNENFGSISCEGFANPSEQYLGNVIKRDVNTVRAYLYLLQRMKLIKIKTQAPILLGKNKNGIDIFQYIPNNYIVKNKLVDDEYYLEFKKDKK